MRVVAPALLLLLLGCEPVVPEGRFACTTDEDCPDEMVCRPERGRCYATLADAAARADSGPADAGRLSDAGPRDGGARDGGPHDAGEIRADAEVDGAAADAGGGADGGP